MQKPCSLSLSHCKCCSLLEGPLHSLPCEKRRQAWFRAPFFTKPVTHTCTHARAHAQTHTRGWSSWLNRGHSRVCSPWMVVNRRVAWVSPHTCHAWPTLRCDNRTKTPPPLNTQGCKHGFCVYLCTWLWCLYSHRVDFLVCVCSWRACWCVVGSVFVCGCVCGCVCVGVCGWACMCMHACVFVLGRWCQLVKASPTVTQNRFFSAKKD